ncbi:hypothetical protein [Streptacidiphilus monticola]|uniref:Uncharacterized protein n=1 Tax=Streptacidiphilus monticola TaxID=2161674 RepID=A0ABW1G884_9ACTN
MTELPGSVDRDILDHRIMQAIVAIRQALGCSIPQAIDEVDRRYWRLRQERPDEFSVPPEEWGRGFYS